MLENATQSSLTPFLTAALTAVLIIGFTAAPAQAGCDAGQWGPLCLPCPGGELTPCNNHGTCDEGSDGSGLCNCTTAYAGTACDQCAPGRYNYPACDVECDAETDCNGAGDCDASGACDCDANLVGASCESCAANYYNWPICDRFCSDAVTCSGNGECDDGGGCDCDAGFTGDDCNTEVNCPAEAVSGCASILGGKSILKVNYSALKPKKNSLIWLWLKGEAFAQSVTDDPSQTANYSLCVYDTDGKRIQIIVSPDDNWVSADPKGWKYTDKTANDGGVTGIKIKTGVAGKTKVQVKAKGPLVPLPAPLGEQFFDTDDGVIVQLHNSDTGFCWTATFVTYTKNTAKGFKGTGSMPVIE